MAAFLGFTLLHGIGVPAEVLPQTPAPALVHTPANIRANRTLPAFTPVSQVQPVSDNPTDEEIGRLRLFPERLVPVKGEAPRDLRTRFGLRHFLAAAFYHLVSICLLASAEGDVTVEGLSLKHKDCGSGNN